MRWDGRVSDRGDMGHTSKRQMKYTHVPRISIDRKRSRKERRSRVIFVPHAFRIEPNLVSTKKHHLFKRERRESEGGREGGREK